MSTTITDPITPTDQAQDHLPVAVWRRYKWHRQRNERPQMAAGLALDDCGFTSQGKREPLRELLISRERDSGLASTAVEQEAEIALESAELEADGPVPRTEPEPGSAEAIEADTRQRIAELRTQIEDMAPEALADGKVAARQKAAEGDLAEVEHTLVNLTRAPRVIARREKSTAQEAERERREQAGAQAQAQVPVVVSLKADVDKQAVALAASAVALRDAMQGRVECVAVAQPGDQMAINAARFRPEEVESAIRFAFQGSDLGLFRGVSGRDLPLVPEQEGQ
jgi:hypothetical protein